MDGRWGFRSGVPEEDLSAVAASYNEGRVEGREFGGEDIATGVKDVFGACGHVGIPDLDKAGRFERCRGVFGVGCEEEFGVLFMVSRLVSHDAFKHEPLMRSQYH